MDFCLTCFHQAFTNEGGIIVSWFGWKELFPAKQSFLRIQDLSICFCPEFSRCSELSLSWFKIGIDL